MNRIPNTPIRFVLFCAKPFRGRLVLFFTLTALGVIAWTISPYFISQLINHLPHARHFDATSWWLIIGFTLLRLIDEWTWRIGDYVMMTVLPNIAVAAREHLFKRVMRHDYHFFVNSSSGQVGHWINEASRIVNDVIESTVWSIWPLVFSFLLSFIVLLTVSRLIAFVFVAWIIALIVYLALSGRKSSRLSAVNSHAKSRASGLVVDVLANYLAVRTFGSSTRENRAVVSANADIIRTRRDSWMYNLGVNAVKGNSAALVGGICLTIAVSLFLSHQATLGSIVLLTTYITSISYQIWELGWQMDNYFRNFGEMSNILQNLLDVENDPVFEKKTRPVEIPHNAALTFDNVSFAYHERPNKPTIKGFSLEVAHGEKIGLVGHSGAGKTTLVALLLGFYPCGGGAIRFGGHDIRELSEGQWRSLVSYVPQDTSLFNRTVRENILYAKPAATEKELQTAIAKAQAKGFIEALPNGLDTVIGERGVKLSGGQRQRIAIARAILRDAPIMILDEATSALDSASEQAIQAALTEAMKGKTVLVVAHRLSTLRHLDRIAVLSRGKLHECGTHNELIRQKGIYADLWDRQLGGFIVE